MEVTSMKDRRSFLKTAGAGVIGPASDVEGGLKQTLKL